MKCPKCKREVEMLKFTTTGVMCRDCHEAERKGTPAVAGAAICSAASSKESERDESDCAPYWLCYALAEYVCAINETCEREPVSCAQSSLCITEWCAPCAALAWLNEQKRLSAPLPPNVTELSQVCPTATKQKEQNAIEPKRSIET